MGVCAACLEGKQHRQPSRIPARRAKEALELVHCNLCGPIDPVSAGGAIYFILFIDDFTRMTYIYPLSGKSSADILQRFKEYQAEVKNQLGKKIKRLRMDGGKEFIKVMGQHLKMCGIIHETTAPYTPEQNGMAERANCTIVERVKAIIAEAKLNRKLWMELANAVIYLKNRSLSIVVPMTPYEMWYGERPDLSHLRTLGIKAYIHIPKQKRIKLDTNSHEGILVGYGGTNQYRVWDPFRKDTIVSRDVVFDEKFYNPEANVVFTSIQVDEPRIIHDSITVLPGPPNDQLPTPPAMEHESDDDEPRPDHGRNHGTSTSSNCTKACDSTDKRARATGLCQIDQRCYNIYSICRRKLQQTKSQNGNDRESPRSQRRTRTTDVPASNKPSNSIERMGESHYRRIQRPHQERYLDPHQKATESQDRQQQVGI